MAEWLTDFWPGTPGSVHTPVLTGTVRSLTGAQLPDGRGLLLWLDGTFSGATVKGAYTSDPTDFVTDGYVTPGDIVSVDATSYVKAQVTVFTDGTDTYYTLVYLRTSDSHGRTEFWKANNPADPLAGWTLLSTLQDAVVGASGSNWNDLNSSVAGMPFIDGTTWHYAGTYWDSALGQHSTRQGIWLSTNSGASWTNKATAGNAQNVIFVAGQIGRSPTNNDLYCQPGNSSVNNTGFIYRSTDDGVTWAATVTYSSSGSEPVYGANPCLVPVCGYLGQTLWVDLDTGALTAKLVSTTDDYLDDLDGTEFTDFGVPYASPITRAQVKAPMLDSKLYVFSGSTVRMSEPPVPPEVGRFYLGRIISGPIEPEI